MVKNKKIKMASSSSTSEHPDLLSIRNGWITYIDIDITEPPIRLGTLRNSFAPQEAVITSITFEDICKDDRKATPEELNEIHHPCETITICDTTTNVRQTFTTDNPDGFTAADLFNCVLEFETISRPLTKWPLYEGGVDIHHTRFTGLTWNSDEQAYEIWWGS